MQATQQPTTITYRPGTPDDSYAVFLVLEHALADMLRRMGHTEPTSIADPVALAQMWAERGPLYAHLAATAEHFWVAEQGGQIVGYARATLRDGVRALTEFFVLPEAQGNGVGRALLSRAFPEGQARLRAVIASPEVRAQAIYMRHGLYPRCPIYYWYRTPEPITVMTDLTITPITDTPGNQAALDEIDREILGHARAADHGYLLRDRQGLIYTRGDQVVGYGYIGHRNGPFALRHPDDFPAVLAHAESQAATAGRDHFGLEIPLLNRAALDHVLARGFQIEPFVAMLLSDTPFGRFDQYIITSPPFIL